MEEFTLSLALVDFIPVLAFGIAIIMISSGFNSALFLIGAIISLLAGVFKVLWKLILGTTKKDVKWLNKSFIPMQSGGWVIMLLGIICNIGKIDFANLLAAIVGMPQLIFFILWLGLMGTMIWYKKNKFERYSAKKNWTAEIINSCAQICLLIAVICAVK